MTFQPETDLMLRASVLLILFCCGNAFADPLYQVTDDKGNVTFTDQPPADGAKGATKTIKQKPLNVLDPSTQNYQQQFDQRTEQRQQQRDTQWQQYNEKLQSAQQQLQQAQKAFDDGKAVKDGDMIGVYSNNRQTGVRPSDAYLERQDALAKAVKAAEANLKAVQKQKPQMHR